MGTKRISIGLIGVGDIGNIHLKKLMRLNGVQIAAIADTNSENLSRAQKIAGSQSEYYLEYQKLLDHKEINAVFICVPSFVHKKITLEALDRGKDIFLEKPLSTTLEDAEETVKAVKKSGRIVQVGLVYRYANIFHRFVKLIKENIIGTPKMIWCHEFRPPLPAREWFHSQELTGGAFNEKNCHHFDIFNWVADAKPLRVFAVGGRDVLTAGNKNVYPLPRGEKGIIDFGDNLDHGWVTVEYENGIKAQLGLCLFLKKSLPLEFGVLGSLGRWIIARKNKIEIGGEEEIEKGLFIGDVEDEFQKKYGGHVGGMEELVSFIDCVRERRKPFADIETGFRASLIAFSAEKSIKEKRVISISELAQSF